VRIVIFGATGMVGQGVVRRLFPRQVTSTERLGLHMLEVARNGHAKRVLEPADLS
jgi:hypothetical protein